VVLLSGQAVRDIGAGQLRDQHDLPTMAFDRSIQNAESAIIGEKALDSLSAHPSGYQKCERRSQKVPGQNEEKTPP
jgi:hypothetical protein